MFSFPSKEKEKETKRKVLVCQPFATLGGVELKTMLTKRSEKQLFFSAKILNPGWEGVKSIPKTGQSLPINGSAMRADLFEDLYSCCGVENQQCRGIL